MEVFTVIFRNLKMAVVWDPALDELELLDARLVSLYEEYSKAENQNECELGKNTLFIDQMGNRIDTEEISFMTADGIMSHWIAFISLLCSLESSGDITLLLVQLSSFYHVVKKCSAHLSEITDNNVAMSRILFLEACLLNCSSDEILIDESIIDSICQCIELIASPFEMVHNHSATLSLLLDCILPNQNLLIHYAGKHPNSGSLSEAIIALANEQSGKDGSLLRSSLRFIGTAIFMEEHSNFFYASDIQVFIDVILREMRNLTEGSSILFHYVSCLAGILQWPQYKIKLFRNKEILALLHGITLIGMTIFKIDLLDNAKPNRDEELCSLITSVLELHINVLEK